MENCSRESAEGEPAELEEGTMIVRKDSKRRDSQENLRERQKEESAKVVGGVLLREVLVFFPMLHIRCMDVEDGGWR
ncbi:hypothetical protein BY996DRAFT_6619056 [Phakopsora pachyrhizi]|nr:hypothetical protein BY996DRAFT_6619056 [Phakopsora pachyrhizi]